MTLRGLLTLALCCPLLACGGDDDAEVVCARLEVCGCLGESLDACQDRISDLDEDQLEECGQCIGGNDWNCHELIEPNGACRGCTDSFATAGKARDRVGVLMLDDVAQCIDVADGGVPDSGT